jgi:tRNA uridine 5-carboxymethylaminomethyl modification enzyme
MNTTFDVIVVGGGHAGIEAAYVAARMGSRTLLLTLDEHKVASMPCNPSVGGLGKGHMVFEVAAFGGLMPRLCSKTYLQARMLNTSKGPAVQGLRLQIDKYAYNKLAVEMLQQTTNLTIISAMTMAVLWDDSEKARKITGVKTADGTIYYAPSVVITTGTFMRGLVHVGRTRYRAGRRGEDAVYGLSDTIAEAMNAPLGRLKTGTPPRLIRESLDFTQFERQDSQPLTFLYEFDELVVEEKMPCFIAYTNEKTHEIISSNLHLSALYSGNIKGTGPRYCPSIEDKVGRYPDRPSHHVFIEPEGADSNEIYPAGLSTSLPLEVQLAYIRSIKGMENAEIAKCGYAIEYDFIQPTHLTHTLEAKTVRGLFLAGQINGTTGYEEAAGQGMLAGINAALLAAGKLPFTLSRQESYIGVMVDDLVTLGADEPYRMFTSRAERRLILRQDNVFLRLMPYARDLGLIDDAQWQKFLDEKAVIQASVGYTQGHGNQTELFKALHCVVFGEAEQKAARELLEPRLIADGLPVTALSSRALLSVHAEVKYAGYLNKERIETEKAARYQQLLIPATFDYAQLPGLSNELQHKLRQYGPKNIAQAQLIPGMTPAAISVLIFQLRMQMDCAPCEF